MSNTPTPPKPTSIKPSGVPVTRPKSARPKAKPGRVTTLPLMTAQELSDQTSKALMALINARQAKPGPKIEAGTNWTHAESGKQYVVIGVSRSEVHIQNSQDPEIKFKIPLPRFLEIYKPVDSSLNLFSPDPARFTFDKMVLFPDTVEAINLGVNRILKWEAMERIWQISKLEPHRKLIISFFGPSGTGKTQAAKCVATLLGKKMLQCDYAQMISKWHGETGKHIKAAFEAATKHDAILFLDEADSLVSQRVSLSVDRMSIASSMNSDRNVFMQEMDKFKGIVILTTNFFDNYDAAIVRRVAKHVHFRLPNQEMRERIFKIHMPNMDRVLAEVNWAEAAKASQGASGGDIFQIMVNAINRASLDPDETKWWLSQAHLITETRETMDAKAQHAGRQSGPIRSTTAKAHAIPPPPPPTSQALPPPTKEDWKSMVGNNTQARLIMAIQRFLLTDEQKEKLIALGLSIPDVLDGRLNFIQEPFALTMLEQWNARLGWKEFTSPLTACKARILS